MSTSVKPIPEGHHTITPHLVVKNGAEAIEFYEKAFGAEERFRMDTPDGKIAHAQLKIGDSLFMLLRNFHR
jgi:PhnB protein